MANLKEVRIRIKSVQNTQQITSAMKMVSAAKLRRAQDSIMKMRPYAHKLTEIMYNLSTDMEDNANSVYSVKRKEEKILIVVETSNKGLCGTFNSSVIKQVNLLLNDTYKEQHKNGNVHFYCIGKKGSEFFNKTGTKVICTNTELFEKLRFEEAKTVAEELMLMFVRKQYDKIVLVYNQFKNAAMQSIQVEAFLPVVATQEEDEDNKSNNDYIFEPNKESILNELIPKSLKIQFYKTLLDSVASEHGARMTAMHKATDNAAELIKELKLLYNRERQAVITNEILEIVSGANALKG